jgi:hypothetical protein
MNLFLDSKVNHKTHDYLTLDVAIVNANNIICKGKRILNVFSFFLVSENYVGMVTCILHIDCL